MFFFQRGHISNPLKIFATLFFILYASNFEDRRASAM
jgi:hypothetical protein